MDNPTYKQILLDIFDALEFSDQEKADALDDFQGELAGALLDKTQDALSQEQVSWLKANGSSLSGNEPELDEIRSAIAEKYSTDDLKALSAPLFKGIVTEYIDYMSQGEDDELKEKLRAIASRL